jgi:poly(3-hydroxybutyrate) depolymerase
MLLGMGFLLSAGASSAQSVDAPAAPAQSSGLLAKLTLRSAERERRYSLYIPASLSASDPAPVLMLLHGSYQNPADMLSLWTELADHEGIILVAPKSWADYGWRIRDDGPELLRDIIDSVAARHPIDRERIYLAGYSAGAAHALTIGLLESQFFAAIAIQSGAWLRPEWFRAISFASRKIPLQITIGDHDEQFPMKSVRTTEAALRSAGFPLTVIIIKDHDHSYGGKLAADANRDSWRFLREVSLGQAPVFHSYH